MKTHSLILALLVIFTQACGNKFPFERPEIRRVKLGPAKLRKMGLTEGAVTTTRTYGYSTDGKLAVFTQTKTADSFQRGCRLYRNAAGLIKTARFRYGSDSLTLDVTSVRETYLGATLHYPDGRSWRYTFAGNADGRIGDIREHDNANADGTRDAYQNFIYNTDNSFCFLEYGNRDGRAFVIRSWRYDYDQKKSPFAYGNDWILIAIVYRDFWYQGLPGNVVRAEDRYGSPVKVTTFSYVYSSRGLPLGFTASSTDTAQLPKTAVFTYW